MGGSNNLYQEATAAGTDPLADLLCSFKMAGNQSSIRAVCVRVCVCDEGACARVGADFGLEAGSVDRSSRLTINQ